MSINFASSATLSQGAGSTVAIQSGTSGLRQVNIPAFAATDANAATQGTVVAWSTKSFDTKNNFSTSTGRFTATIAGTYYFKYHQLCNYATAGEYRINIRHNASAQWGRSIFYKSSASQYTTIQVEAKINLSVNDYVDCYVEQAPAAMAADVGWAFFQGYRL